MCWFKLFIEQIVVFVLKNIVYLKGCLVFELLESVYGQFFTDLFWFEFNSCIKRKRELGR